MNFITAPVISSAHAFDELSSTSEWAKEHIRAAHPNSPPHGVFVTAGHQTAGRGRHDRSWHSPARKSLLCSLILNIESSDEAQRKKPAFISDLAVPGAQFLSFAVPVAVCEAAREFVSEATVKFPNDIVIQGRKIGGILLEQISIGSSTWVVAGVGLNVGQTIEELPADCRYPATSLFLETGHTPRVDLVAEAYCSRLDEIVTFWDFNRVILRMREICGTLGKTVRIEIGDETVEGTAANFSAAGELLVETSSGLRKVKSGQILRLDTL